MKIFKNDIAEVVRKITYGTGTNDPYIVRMGT